jgi:CO/xanthine dehydrogenase FAD-binding subunit
MRTAISSLTLLRPRTLSEALTMLRDDGPLTPMAGCTDLYVSLEFGTLPDRRFIDLWGLDGLRGIREQGSRLRIGALATYSDLIASPLVRRWLPMLAAASREVGGAQIQNRGTIGGNIANASPAGDTLPVLAAAGAVVMLRSAAGQRRVPFTSYYTGYRQSVRQNDEIVLAVEIPRVDGRQWWRKVGTRRAQAISKVMMAAVCPPRRDDGVRVAFGSLGPTVIRAAGAERVLTEGGSIDAAIAALHDDVRPIDDIRSTAAYRRTVAGNLLAQFWHECAH